MPNRDNAPVLDMILEKLAQNTQYPDYELLVIDDGSTDGSVELLRRWESSGRFADFRLIEHAHGEGGVVDALNAGLHEATGELVVQLDADASVETPGWLAKMVSFLTSDGRVGVVTAKVVTDRGRLQACGIEVVSERGFHDRGAEIAERIGHRSSHQRVRRFSEAQAPGCGQIAEVDGGIGVCMLYRRSAALAVGGYDRGYAPVWFDDLDLTMSLRREGGKVFYLPDVRVIHHLEKRARPIEQLSSRRRLAQRVGDAVPYQLRTAIIHALALDRGPDWYQARLYHHYRYWEEKWGWDMLNPDMAAIRARWGDTEICWRENPSMRRAGEEIIAAFQG